jgi:hypothetical protein
MSGPTAQAVKCPNVRAYKGLGAVKSIAASQPSVISLIALLRVCFCRPFECTANAFFSRAKGQTVKVRNAFLMEH